MACSIGPTGHNRGRDGQLWNDVMKSAYCRRRVRFDTIDEYASAWGSLELPTLYQFGGTSSKPYIGHQRTIDITNQSTNPF